MNVEEEIRKRLKGPESTFSVDATPDDEYAIRILGAYIDRTRVRWEVHGCDESTKMIYDAMNDAQDKRAEILRVAITKLKEAPDDGK